MLHPLRILLFVTCCSFHLLPAQPLEMKMSGVWLGEDPDDAQLKWSIHPLEGMDLAQHFGLNTVGDELISLRSPLGQQKFSPCLVSPKSNQKGFSPGYGYFPKEIRKKFNTGLMTMDPVTGRVWFTHERKGRFTILNSDKATGGKKADIQPFPYSNKAFSTAWPTISRDGQRLYFASDMPGGQGGWDLYMCRRLDNGWSPPENLGEAVNSPRDEKYPFLAPGGTLYFSSDRKQSRDGDYDIYEKPPEGAVTAMPYPINTRFNDWAFIVLDTNAKVRSPYNEGRAYVVSTRPRGPESFPGPLTIYRLAARERLSGVVEHKRRMEPLGQVQVRVEDEFGVTNTLYTDEAGRFSFMWEPYRRYELRFSRAGMDTVKKTIEYSPKAAELIMMDDSAYWEVTVYVNHQRAQVPLPHATVILLANEAPVDTLYTDGKGKVSFELRRGPAYKFKVEKGGFKVTDLKVSPPPTPKYRQSLYARLPEEKLTFIQGRILGPDSLPMINVEVRAYEGLSPVDLHGKVKSDTAGRFELIMDKNREITVVAVWGGRMAGIAQVTTGPGGYRARLDTMEAELRLRALETDKVCAEFLYEGDPILLQAGKYPEMQTWLRFLQAMPGLKIEIGVHTDTRKDTRTSWSDGKRAADFAADFFFINDIARDRVKTTSFGRSRPVINCRDCSQVEHQANRRVLIKVLEL